MAHLLQLVVQTVAIQYLVALHLLVAVAVVRRLLGLLLLEALVVLAGVGIAVQVVRLLHQAKVMLVALAMVIAAALEAEQVRLAQTMAVLVEQVLHLLLLAHRSPMLVVAVVEITLAHLARAEQVVAVVVLL